MRKEIMQNKEIIAYVIKFAGQRFKVQEGDYLKNDATSATFHTQVPGHNWKVSARASIVDDEVHFGIRTIGGGHGYGAHLFTDTVTPAILDRYLEKAYKSIMDGIAA